MLLKSPTELNVQRCIEMTEPLLEELALSTDVPIHLCWQQFWHMTRIIEWPWALEWIEPGQKVLDIGADATFALHCLRAGVGEVTMHHTAFDTEHLGRVLVHTVGWTRAHDIFRKLDRKLKLIWGYPDQLDVPDETYDVVTNLSVMEHVEPENWRGWMEFCYRVLKPGGLLVMSCDYLCGGQPEGVQIDITNHPYWEFFCDHRELMDGFMHSMTHVPWHPDFDPKVFEESMQVAHPANRDGMFTVYGFVVRKNS